MLEEIQYFFEDLFEDHKIACIIGIIVIVLAIIMFSIRSHNLAKKAEEEARKNAENTEQTDVLQEEPIPQQTTSDYTASLGINGDKGDGRVTVKDESGKVNDSQKISQTEPSFGSDFYVFDKTGVPDTMVDGSSIKDYLAGVDINYFDLSFISKLVSDDFYTSKRYLIGVEQDKNNFIKGDLQSVGWLINNIGNIGKNDALTFTNLHVVGKIKGSDNAVLCCYDWYSAFGIDDTLVVFKDISGTVKNKDLSPGNIFTATVYRHNVKVEKVNGQNVVCVGYAVFNDNKEY